MVHVTLFYIKKKQHKRGIGCYIFMNSGISLEYSQTIKKRMNCSYYMYSYNIPGMNQEYLLHGVDLHCDFQLFAKIAFFSVGEKR